MQLFGLLVTGRCTRTIIRGCSECNTTTLVSTWTRTAWSVMRLSYFPYTFIILKWQLFNVSMSDNCYVEQKQFFNCNFSVCADASHQNFHNILIHKSPCFPLDLMVKLSKLALTTVMDLFGDTGPFWILLFHVAIMGCSGVKYINSRNIRNQNGRVAEEVHCIYHNYLSTSRWFKIFDRSWYFKADNFAILGTFRSNVFVNFWERK